MASHDADNFKQEHSSDDDKARVSQLGNRLLALQSEVADLDQQLKDKKRELRNVEELELPEAMDKVGLSEFKTTTGLKVSVKPFYNASIPSERKDEALDWLELEGHGGIIKTEVSVSFGKGELAQAQAFKEFARGFNEVAVDPELSRGVHAQTLKAFVREMIEGGAAIPLDLLGVYNGRKATVKPVK
jgi:hypothetical protein